MSSMSYLSPLALSTNVQKEAQGLDSYVIQNGSYFSEALEFVLQMNAEYNAHTKTFYRSIAESQNNTEVINESFADFFKSVKKLIDKFIAFIKRLVAKFITKLNSLVKSDKYLEKHKKDFSKFNSKCEFSFEGYKYTFDSAVPVINALTEFNKPGTDGAPGEDLLNIIDPSKLSINTTEVQSDKIAEQITNKYKELINELDGDYYDIFRARVLGKNDDFIPQEDFAKECFAIFRNDSSDKEIIDVTANYVIETYTRFSTNEKFYKSVENTKKTIEKDYGDIKKNLDKIVTANYDSKINAIINLPNGVSISKDKAQNLLSSIDLFVKAKSVQVQKMCDIHALAFAAKLDAIKEQFIQDKTILYKSLSKIQATIKESVIVSDDTIEDDLMNDYVDPIDDQEIIDTIMNDGNFDDKDAYYRVMEAFAISEAIGEKDPSKITSISKINKEIGRIEIKLNKFEKSYEWYKNLTPEEKKNEINKKRFERIALSFLSFFTVIGIYSSLKYQSDIENGELPADIFRNPDSFYRGNIASMKGRIADLEKRKKELADQNTTKDNYSYAEESANYIFLQNLALEQYELDKAIKEAMIISEGTDSFNKIKALNEGATDKIKEIFKKIMSFIKQTFSKFVATMDELIKKDSEYLKKYKDIILKKPLKEATYTMPDYANGIKNIVSVVVPMFNYDQMKDTWLKDEGQFQEKVFAGKQPAALANNSFGDNCKMIFRGSENNIDYKSDQLNMTDIYNYCIEYNKMKDIIDKDIKTLEKSNNQIDNFLNSIEKDLANGNTTNNTENNNQDNKGNNTDTGTEENKNESVYSFLYGSYITEADDDKGPSGGVKINSAPTGDNNNGNKSTTAAGNTNNIDKDSKGDTKDSLKNSASNNADLNDIKTKLSLYSRSCSTLFSSKLTIAQEIYKAYMQIISNHVKNYVGTDNKQSKIADAGTDYSNLSEDSKNSKEAKDAQEVLNANPKNDNEKRSLVDKAKKTLGSMSNFISNLTNKKNNSSDAKQIADFDHDIKIFRKMMDDINRKIEELDSSNK